MSDNQYIDIVFDGPPNHDSGRFVEVEDERGRGIRAGEWIKPDPEGDGMWRLRLKVRPGFNNTARRINETSAAHGFWPDDRTQALGAAGFVAGRLSALHSEGKVPQEEIDQMALIINYIRAQEVRNMGEMLMLAVSELAEGLEEHRDRHPVHWHRFTLRHVQPIPDAARPALARLQEMGVAMASLDDAPDPLTPEEIRTLVMANIAKPEGLAVELADCIIRCLDTMQSLGVDIDDIIEEKMVYNEGRPFKHGKSY